MKIDLNKPETGEQERVVSSGKTFIAPNLIRESEMLDKFGNVIDPRTKQIIKSVNQQ